MESSGISSSVKCSLIALTLRNKRLYKKLCYTSALSLGYYVSFGCTYAYRCSVVQTTWTIKMIHWTPVSKSLCLCQTIALIVTPPPHHSNIPCTLGFALCTLLCNSVVPLARPSCFSTGLPLLITYFKRITTNKGGSWLIVWVQRCLEQGIIPHYGLTDQRGVVALM